MMMMMLLLMLRARLRDREFFGNLNTSWKFRVNISKSGWDIGNTGVEEGSTLMMMMKMMIMVMMMMILTPGMEIMNPKGVFFISKDVNHLQNVWSENIYPAWRGDIHLFHTDIMVIFQEHFLDFGGRSWFQKWRLGTPNSFYLEPRPLRIKYKRFGIKILIQLWDNHVCHTVMHNFKRDRKTLYVKKQVKLFF